LRTICVHEKQTIENFCRQDTYLHLYAIGDLDDFFWPYTTWYALEEGGTILQLVLLYFGGGLPILLAQAGDSPELMEELLHSILHLLPRRLYTHLSPGLIDVLAREYQIESHGIYFKMGLTDKGRLEVFDTSATIPLTRSEQVELEALYQASYPGNWFDSRMLETGHYYGIRRQGRLVSVAGIHVYSPRYGVAALGNITTHPEFRGQGLGTLASARLCQELLKTVEHIGLHVKKDNTAAIACYKKLGFTVAAEYQEAMLTPKGAGRRPLE
jgi:ribosomal protein S18 acetylase RimI-like enzyme